jgi:SAM-dependent methyltransferase
MSAEELRRRMAEVADRHGPWHSHNIHLGDGVWTLSDHELVEASRARRYLQVVADAAAKPLEQLRVLDLACEEGIFGIELARRGATVVGVEGRPGNVARARFAAEALGLGERYQVHEDDVRAVDAASYGRFDVILNIGILYHLDAPAVFELVFALAGMCEGLMLLSTHHGRFGERGFEFRGRSYRGSVVQEHRPRDSAEQRERNLRASLDNPVSVWLTRPSLYNLLADAGFSSVLELRVPRAHLGQQPGNMVNLLAFRGERFEVPVSAAAGPGEAARWPEREPRDIFAGQTIPGRLKDAARRRGLPELLGRIRGGPRS